MAPADPWAVTHVGGVPTSGGGDTLAPQAGYEPTGGLGGWAREKLEGAGGPEEWQNKQAGGLLAGAVMSGGRGAATLLDLASDPLTKEGITVKGSLADKAVQAMKGGKIEQVAQRLKNTSDWLKQGSHPEGFWENVGGIGEQVLEYLATDGLLKVAGPTARAAQAAEGVTAATRSVEELKNAQQVANTLAKNPKLAGLVAMGLEQGSIQAGQTYLHTEDPNQALAAGAVGAALPAAPLGISRAGKTARAVLDKFAPETVDIAEQAGIPVAEGQLSKAGEILPTGAQNAPEVAAAQQRAFESHLQNISRVGATNSIGRILEAQGPPQRLALPAPEGAEPFKFTLYGTPPVERAEGSLLQPAEQLPGRQATATVGGPPSPGFGPEFQPGSTWQQTPQGAQPPPGYMHPVPAINEERTAEAILGGEPARPSAAQPARETVVGGGGFLQDPDPQKAIAWRNHYEHVIGSPEFKDLPTEQQAEIRRNYEQLRDQLGMYYAKPHGGFAPVDMNKILNNIVSPGDTAAQIYGLNETGWKELDRVSGGDLSRLQEQVASAKRTIWNPDASAEAKQAARAARDKAQSSIDSLITQHAGETSVTRDYYKAMKQGHADASFFDNLNDEIESMTNGVTRENTASGKLVRVVTGNTRGLENFLQDGMNRKNLVRLMGDDAEENLKAFTQLLSNPGTTRSTGEVLSNVLRELGTKMGVGGGLLWGPGFLLMHHGTEAAALGATLGAATYGTRQLLRYAAANPNVGRLVEYAVNNNVDSKIYAPLIARAIMTPLQSQEQSQGKQEESK